MSGLPPIDGRALSAAANAQRQDEIDARAAGQRELIRRIVATYSPAGISRDNVAEIADGVVDSLSAAGFRIVHADDA